MRRRLLPALAAVGLVAAAAAILVLRRGADAPPPPAPAVEAEVPAQAPAPAPMTERERARRRWAEMAQALQTSRALKRVVPVTEARPGEPAAFTAERRRAVEEYRRFVDNLHVPPERDEALRGVILDAQENWRAALQAAGRAQPFEPGAELADPTLHAIWTALDEEFRRRAREALPEDQAAMFQSFVPTVLPFLRTQAFEAR